MLLLFPLNASTQVILLQTMCLAVCRYEVNMQFYLVILDLACRQDSEILKHSKDTFEHCVSCSSADFCNPRKL